MLPHFIFFCWCLYFIEAQATADKKCWTMEDVRSRRDGSISCPEGKIFMKDLTVKTEYGELFGCYHRTLSMLKCNGLHPICDSNNTDILASIEKYVEDCYSWIDHVNACIIYDCIQEKFNSMVITNSSALTATRGSYFLAPQFTGFLRCSMYGNISNITISKSTIFLVRIQNGTKILEYDKVDYWHGCSFHEDSERHSKNRFTCSMNVNADAVEINLNTKTIVNIIMIIQGVTSYRCQNSISAIEIGKERPDEASTSIVQTPGKCTWLNVKRLRWITTFVSISLTVLLVGSCVINCILWKAFKVCNSMP